MMRRTKSEQRAYEAAQAAGSLGKRVVYGSRPATDAQMALIRRLFKQAGYSYEGEAIKAALGKIPTRGTNRERACIVIDPLQTRISARCTPHRGGGTMAMRVD